MINYNYFQIMGITLIAQVFKENGLPDFTTANKEKLQKLFTELTNDNLYIYPKIALTAVSKELESLELDSLYDHPVIHYWTPTQIEDIYQFICNEKYSYGDIIKTYFKILVDNKLGIYVF